MKANNRFHRVALFALAAVFAGGARGELPPLYGDGVHDGAWTNHPHACGAWKGGAWKASAPAADGNPGVAAGEFRGDSPLNSPGRIHGNEAP